MAMSQTKVCPRCPTPTPKPIEEFSLRAQSADGRDLYCRKCKRAINRRSYEGNKKAHIAANRAAMDRRRVEVQEFVWNFLLSHPCADCGEGDPIVLDFDHLYGKRKHTRGVSEMTRGCHTVETVAAEIEKCAVRCANCHRRKTARERGYWRSERTNTAS